jgi:hypothetical protein
MNKQPATLPKPSFAKRTPVANAAVSTGLRSGFKEEKNVPEEVIRIRAYRKWEAAGKPPGDGVQFWLAAEGELLQDQ